MDTRAPQRESHIAPKLINDPKLITNGPKLIKNHIKLMKKVKKVTVVGGGVIGVEMPSKLIIHICTVLTCVFFAQTNANVCEQKQIQLRVLGSGGPELDDGRASSSYLVLQDGQARYLLDTGSGASLRFGESGAKFEHLDAIFLSHLHIQ